MPLPCDWIDAFATRPFHGNGCLVVHDADGLSEADRLAIVRETNLSECAFVVSSDRADFGARYYLATREILFAGHPTVATVRALIHRGKIQVGDAPVDITLEVGAGVLPIHIEPAEGGPRITMTQAAPEFAAEFEAEEIGNIMGLSAEDIVGTPQIVSTGTAFCITEIATAEALAKARLDVPRLDAWRQKVQREDAGIMEPFLVHQTAGNCQTLSRLLLAPPLPAEDPFTGSATGCMAAYLWAKGRLSAPSFTAGQGDHMGRPGRAVVHVEGPREAISGVKVGGQGAVVFTGKLGDWARSG